MRWPCLRKRHARDYLAIGFLPLDYTPLHNLAFYALLLRDSLNDLAKWKFALQYPLLPCLALCLPHSYTYFLSAVALSCSYLHSFY